MVRSQNRIVYITIEKRHREFDSKTLVAAELLVRGVTVVIGYTYGVFGALLRAARGILYIKGLNKAQYDMVKDVPKLGHLIVATDEEAVGSCEPAFIMKDCWKDMASVLQMVLCQGEVHRQALIDLRGFSRAQTVISGNPRLDLLRPPFSAPVNKRAAEIRDEFGRFTLINTDCGFVNSAVMDLDVSRKALIGIGFINPEDPDDIALMEEVFTYDRNNLRAIEDFIRAMEREQPERRLILRPHPAEREDTWRKIEREVSNLKIVTNTPAPEWIAVADCVIQTGCTTGVEAAILGTPTIGLCCHPETLRYPRWLLSNEPGFPR